MPRVITVTGPVEPENLGVTAVHEHLLLDISFYHHCLFQYPLEAAKAKLAEAKLSMEHLALARRNQFLIKDNLRLEDEELATAELKGFRQYGGTSIVEVTLPGMGRDVTAIRRIARKTGVNVIAATGWYVAPFHPPYVRQQSIDDLRDIMVKELTEGIENTGIRAGVIKCAVGGVTGDPGSPIADGIFHPDEEKVLRAAARAQKATGAPMTMHPCIFRRDGQRYIDVLEEEGADLTKFWMSHLSSTFPDMDVRYCISLIERGVSISLDSFGYEKYSQLTGWTCITDKERVRALVELCRLGYDREIMLSHDTCQKDRLKKYGGYGYSHLLENIVPELRQKGVTESQITNMLVENPKRILAY